MGYPDFYLVVPYKLRPRVSQTASPFLRPPPPHPRLKNGSVAFCSVPQCQRVEVIPSDRVRSMPTLPTPPGLPSSLDSPW